MVQDIRFGTDGWRARIADSYTFANVQRCAQGFASYLQELGQVVKECSLCGLGKSAPNPVLSTLKYFRSEYEAHVEQKKCPAGVCTALITYSIDPELCTGCHACFNVCPHEAIEGERKESHKIDPDICTRCGSCIEVCKFEAIEVS